MTFNFDTSELTQTAARRVTPHDNCIVTEVGAGAFPRYIKVQLPDDDGPQQVALWDGSLDLEVNDEVYCHEYAEVSVWRVMAMGGNDSGAGKVRVSKVWESDFGAPALQADATGQIGISMADPAAKLEINALLATDIVQINKAAGSQSANILENRDSSDSLLSGVDERGIIWSDGDTDITNFFAGDDAGRVATTGTGNVGVGSRTLLSLTSGVSNIAIGSRAGEKITSGASNVMLGLSAGFDLTTGSNNFGLGTVALTNLTTGASNVAIGTNALKAVNTGASNTAIGTSAGVKITTGASNIAIGVSALSNLTTTASNVAIGVNAGRQNVTGASNVYIGVNSGDGAGGNSNSFNTFIGALTGSSITTGSSNVLIGFDAGGSITTESNKLFIANADIATPLVYGEFDNDFIRLYAATAITNSVHDVLHLSHITSASPILANFGIGLKFQLESTTSEDQDAARISALWTTATHATRTSALTFETLTGAGALTEQMRIDGDGNVGIGTASPITTLQLTDAAFPAITIEDLNEAADEKIWQMLSNGGSFEIRTRTDANGAGTTALFITRSGVTTGNVGIGTTSPSAKLHTIDEDAVTAAVTDIATLGHNSTGAPAADFGAGVLYQLETSTTPDQDAARIAAILTNPTHATLATALVFETLTGAGSLTEQMRIAGNGVITSVSGRIKATTRIDDGDSPYTVLATDEIILADTDGGAITVNLPAGVDGTHYRITNTGTAANDVTIDPNGSEQLFGGGAGVSFALIDAETINIYFETTEGWW